MTIKMKIFLAILTLVVGSAAIGGYAYCENKKYEAQAFSLFGYKISVPELRMPELYDVYKLYMDWVRGGVSSGRSHIALPSTLVGYFNRMPTSTPRYAYGLGAITTDHTTRFNWAMTDCYEIYFGGTSGRNLVDNLKNNRSLTRNQVYWLSHELAHGEQCSRWGGRRNFANRWFSQIFDVIWKKVLTGNFSSIVSTVYNANITELDNQMGMEMTASQRADAVLRAFDVMRYPFSR